MAFRATGQVVQTLGLTEGARNERLQSSLGGVAVDLDSEAEGVVDLAALLGRGGGEDGVPPDLPGCAGHEDPAATPACRKVLLVPAASPLRSFPSALSASALPVGLNRPVLTLSTRKPGSADDRDYAIALFCAVHGASRCGHIVGIWWIYGDVLPSLTMNAPTPNRSAGCWT